VSVDVAAFQIGCHGTHGIDGIVEAIVGTVDRGTVGSVGGVCGAGYHELGTVPRVELRGGQG